MTEAVCYLQRRKAKFYQHTCVAVPQVMHSDDFQACFFGSSLDFLFQSMLGKIEYSVTAFDTVELRKIFLYIIIQNWLLGKAKEIATGCIRTNGSTCEGMGSPAKKRFCSEHGKGMTLYPESMALYGAGASSLCINGSIDLFGSMTGLAASTYRSFPPYEDAPKEGEAIRDVTISAISGAVTGAIGMKFPGMNHLVEGFVDMGVGAGERGLYALFDPEMTWEEKFAYTFNQTQMAIDLLLQMVDPLLVN